MINKVFLLGRLVADPQLQYTESGTPYARFRIAVNTPYKDSKGEWQQETLFIGVLFWGEKAEKLVELSKGAKVFVMGRLRQGNYEENGKRKSYIEVKGERVVVIEDKKNEQPEIEF